MKNLNTFGKLTVMALLILLTNTGFTQQYTPRILMDSVFKALSKENNKVITQKDLEVSSVSNEKLQKAYIEYKIFQMRNNQENFEWNLKSTIIIFWMVIFLVFSGIAFSGIQFYKATMNRKELLKDDTQNELNTNIEASMQGIKISSPVLGIIILTISLAFFYLYLIYVYPIIQLNP
jgi:hypothetical protein